MCGICLLIRQRIVRAAQTPADGTAGTNTSAQRHPLHAAVTLTTSSATVVPVDEQGDTASATLVPSSADACSLVPCMCAKAGLDVRSFLSSADAANPLFHQVLHNLRRRGPDTYGVTRRSFVTSCLEPVERHLFATGEREDSPSRIRSDAKEEDKARDKEDEEEEEGDTYTTRARRPSAAAGTSAPSLKKTVPLMLRTEVAGVASVLGLRGHSTVAQPYDMNVAADCEDDQQANSWDYRSSLLWNGEIFGGALCPPPWGSDTVLLATRLSQMELECVRLTESAAAAAATTATTTMAAKGSEAAVLPLLPLVERQRVFLRRCTTLFEQQVEGPYSFIFIATRLRLAVFGRDPLGRHSLLSHVRVTQPPAASTESGDSELDVELIVSSVGVQHHHPSHRHENGVSEEGEGGQGGGEAARHHAETHAGRSGASLSTSSALSQPHSPGASKRPRHEKKAAPSRTSAAAMAGEEDEEGGDDGRAGARPNVSQHNGAAAAGEEEPEEEKDEEVCWQEVGVTGLFAVPLQAPLIYCDATSSSSSPSSPSCCCCCCHDKADNEHAHTGTEDQSHPVCVSSLHATAGSNGSSSKCCGATALSLISKARVLLLHCPWQRTHHLVHPLLRTAALPLVLHEPPPFELILAHEEIAVLPEPLLRWAGHLMKGMQPDSGGLDQSWVDWAAAHYMLALAVSMHRRITVANSGAADGRDAQELSTARRRPLCILFSGGIDCTVLAALAHYILPVETPIELVNVAFGDSPEEAPDRVAAFRSMEELLRLPLLSTSRGSGSEGRGGGDGGTAAREREWRLVLVDVPTKETAESAHIKDLLVPRHTVMDLDIGTALWHAARASGRMQMLRRSDVDGADWAGGSGGDSFDGTPPITAPGSPTSATAVHRLGSGSSPTITLDSFSKHFRAYTGATAVSTSVAYEGSSGADTSGMTATTTSATGAAPVEGGGGVGSAALPQPSQSLASEEVASVQKYQILVDILAKEGRGGSGPLTPVLLSTLGKEYSLFLQPHIKRYGYKKLGSFLNDAAKAGYITFAADAPSKAVRLCRPCDMERAVAVPPSRWFTTLAMTQAREGQQAGMVLPAEGTFTERYTSHAKVVLLGMGADETLGGYTRYRRFFSREGMPGAQRELERDFGRLWQRNLGRDDRITMDSGREPRFPFLDEGVLRTLEWIVLKRRNNVIAAHEQQQQQQYMSGSPTAQHPASPSSPSLQLQPPLHASSHSATSPTNTTAAAAAAAHGQSHRRGAVPQLTHEDVLRHALDPIVSFRLPPGEGDKRVLRRVARVLGLGDVTHLQKRAIQFGSRIAERKIKGTKDF